MGRRRGMPENDRQAPLLMYLYTVIDCILNTGKILSSVANSVKCRLELDLISSINRIKVLHAYKITKIYYTKSTWKSPKYIIVLE